MNAQQRQRSVRRFGAWGLLIAIIALPTIIAFAPLVAAIGHIGESAVNAVRNASLVELSMAVMFTCVVIILAIMIRQGTPPARHKDPRDDS